MAQYPLGIIIRQRRDMLGLSQQQLCQGICDRSTLSRIERGDQVPAYSTLRALLQRLGLQEKDVHFLLGQPDFETAQLQKEIVALNTRKQWLQAQQKIRELQALPTDADPLTRQFILRAKALAGYEQDGKAVPYPYEEQRQMLLEALQISCPGIDPEHLQGHLLGEEEGKLLNQIAITYSESGERRRAALSGAAQKGHPAPAKPDPKGAARDCHCAFCAVPDLPVRLLAGQLAHVLCPAVFDPKRLSVPHPRCTVCAGKLLKQVCILRTLFRA